MKMNKFPTINLMNEEVHNGSFGCDNIYLPFWLKALFSNFVAIVYKIGLNYLFSSQNLRFMRKELANLVPTYKMAIITLKSALGF